ncbi:hypothetical protein CK203_069804 [Vitis vinifera]|uniref:Uncharacterized protein n=1 Tax=Vitis vinifera TaxID=29760 RepID=A0A438E088_VITVI|nr:hypothetical protein CK203_069804 [Vitis vinifera]
MLRQKGLERGVEMGASQQLRSSLTNRRIGLLIIGSDGAARLSVSLQIPFIDEGISTLKTFYCIHGWLYSVAEIVIHRLCCHAGDITCIAWAPEHLPIGDQKSLVLATSSVDKKVKLWVAPPLLTS